MHKRLKQLATALLCLAGCTPMLVQKPAPSSPVRNWAVCYGCDQPAEAFKHLDLVVFDGRYHPDFSKLKGTTVLGYVTMGETYDDAPEKPALEENNILLFHNKNWNSHAVDLTSPQWQAVVMESVDRVMAKGFDGVFLDTVDSPLAWAREQGPERYQGMREAALSLLHQIRAKYPEKRIMLNRGFDILAEASSTIDYVLAESILTHKDDLTGQFRLLPPKAYLDAMGQLHTIVARAEKLQVMTLDYWDMEDRDGVEHIYEKQRAAGFAPYVTTPDLKYFTPEPRKRKPSGAGE